MMKHSSVLAAILLASSIGTLLAQDADQSPPPAPPTYFAFIHSPGEKWVDSLPSFRQPGIEQHVAYYSALTEVGKIILGGPFLNAAGGIMVYKGDDLEEATRVAQSDPGVKNGLLKVKVRQWLVVLSSQ
jgi:uncharacterized protein YciI